MARKLTSLDLDNKVRLAIAALQKVPSRLGLSEAEWIETVRRGSREQVSAADALMVMAGSLDGKKVYDGRSYTRGAIKCAEYGQRDRNTWGNGHVDSSAIASAFGRTSLTRPDKLLELEDEQRRITEGLRRLQPIDRKLLELTLYDGATPKEIAAGTRQKVGTIRSRIYRARRRLRQSMEQLSA